MSTVRRRPRPAKTIDTVMRYVEAEMARVVAADPAVAASRQRALRRAFRRAAGRELAPAF